MPISDTAFSSVTSFLLAGGTDRKEEGYGCSGRSEIVEDEVLHALVLDELGVVVTWGVMPCPGSDPAESDIEFDPHPFVVLGTHREGECIVHSGIDVFALIAVTDVLVIVVACT